MRLISIASGSSGNCFLVASEKTSLLVDAGLSRKKVKEGLENVGYSIDDIDGILATHEHIDHIRGLGVITRQDKIQVYSTEGTLRGIFNNKSLGNLDEDYFNLISIGETFTIGDIEIKPFETFHDVNEPCGYTFKKGSKKAGIITDTGSYNSKIVDELLDVNALLIESNHDLEMLDNGDYPYFLKERIKSNIGHMSNDTCSELLNRILHKDMEGIILGHLSKDNNTPDKALDGVKSGIDLDTYYTSDDFEITVANRHTPSKPVDL